MEESEAKLQPGVAFRLQPDGQWKPEKIPPEVLKEAKFSGYLTIQGYRCTVFEMPDKNQYAQKSTGTLASKITSLWLSSSDGVPPAPTTSAQKHSDLQECPDCGNGPLTTDENGLAECPDCGWEEKARSMASQIAARWLR